MKKTLIMSVLAAGMLTLTGCGSTSDVSGETVKTEVLLPQFSKSFIKFFGGAGRDLGAAGAFDSQNNFYAVGTTEANVTSTPNAGGQDLFLAKFDSNGNLLCAFQYGTSGTDKGIDVAVDSSDYVYITGSTDRDFDGHTYLGGGSDIYVMKFNASCVKQTSLLIGSIGDEASTGLTIDTNDNIFLTGWTDNSINSEPSQGGQDFFITKLSTDLTTIWTTQDGSDGNDWANDIAVDNNGNLYVVGSLDNDIVGETTVQGAEDGFVAKYSSGDGSRIWITNFGAANDSGGNDAAHSVSIASDGSAVVGFHFVDSQSSGVARFDTDGLKMWQVKLTYYGPMTVTVGENDDIYAGEPDGSYSTTLFKLDKNGESIWSYSFDTIYTTYALTTDLFYNPNTKNVYAIGSSGSDFAGDNAGDNEHSGNYDMTLIGFN